MSPTTAASRVSKNLTFNRIVAIKTPIRILVVSIKNNQPLKNLLPNIEKSVRTARIKKAALKIISLE